MSVIMMPGVLEQWTSREKWKRMQQERSVGGTSSLNGYQSSWPRRDGEKIIYVCITNEAG